MIFVGLIFRSPTKPFGLIPYNRKLFYRGILKIQLPILLLTEEIGKFIKSQNQFSSLIFHSTKNL